MVLISEKSIEKIILGVAPKVEWLTKWSCDLDNLEVKIISRSQLWRKIIQPKMDLLEFDTKPRNFLESLGTEFMKLSTSYFPLGVYEPDIGGIYVISENLEPISENGLAVILGHELVHRCQHVHNPEFFDLLQDYTKEIGLQINDFQEKMYKVYGATLREMVRKLGLKNFQKRSKSMLAERKKLIETVVLGPVQTIMSLIEGDAYFVQNQLKKMFYQDAENLRTPSKTFILGTLSSYFPEIKAKLDQYIVGGYFIKNVYHNHGREMVNSLYKLELYKLEDTFKKFQKTLEEKNEDK